MTNGTVLLNVAKVKSKGNRQVPSKPKSKPSTKKPKSQVLQSVIYKVQNTAGEEFSFSNPETFAIRHKLDVRSLKGLLAGTVDQVGCFVLPTLG